MKALTLILITPALFMVFACGNNSSNADSRDKDSTTVARDMDSDLNTEQVQAPQNGLSDEEFAKEAANGGLAEVALGKLAIEKATDAKVKEFAQMMVTDHTKANDELKALASAKSITLPTAPKADKQMTKDELSSLTGAAFDKAYAEQMVVDHEKTVALFEAGKTSVQDPELVAFIDKTLPVIKEHLEHSKKLSK